MSDEKLLQWLCCQGYYKYVHMSIFFISFPHTVQFLHFIKAPRMTFSCYPLRAELQVVTSNDHSYVFVIYTIHMTLVL